MLCALKVRRIPEAEGDDLPFRLLITSKHAVGGAGGVISDEARYPAPDSLLAALRSLQVPAEALATAGEALETDDAEHRWLPVASGVQIPFEALTAAGFDLEDESD